MNTPDKNAKHTKKNDTEIQASDLANSVVDVASAYMSNPSNRVDIDQIPKVIRTIASEIMRIQEGDVPHATEPLDTSPSRTAESGVQSVTTATVGNPAQKPAVPVDKSIYPGQIYCLECGKSFKTMRRHLRDVHGMSEDEYRTKWGLPSSYPMVCEEYSKQRSELALQRTAYFGKPYERPEQEPHEKTAGTKPPRVKPGE
ncbi:MucR family transcriptional regulator [Acetobacter malorum]|uniref:MucR family transcriptional regulator n=1 Tax=Acetobacter malorum TaxID=178901 RepID=UPI000776B189|nr:MucR family transcriptional regulator [Acetobacter malorum]